VAATAIADNPSISPIAMRVEDKLKVHMVFPPDAPTPVQGNATTQVRELRHRYPEALEGPN
jgi:hypothetical protein